MSGTLEAEASESPSGFSLPETFPGIRDLSSHAGDNVTSTLFLFLGSRPPTNAWWLFRLDGTGTPVFGKLGEASAAIPVIARYSHFCR